MEHKVRKPAERRPLEANAPPVPVIASRSATRGASEPLASGRSGPPGEERDHREHQEDEERDLREACRGARDPAETEHGGDEGDDEQRDGDT